MRKTIFILGLFSAICAGFMVSYRPTGHVCPFVNCPYQGLQDEQARFLNDRLNEDGTDSHCIDALHLLYPSANYDVLENYQFAFDH